MAFCALNQLVVTQYLLQIRYEFRLQNIPLFCDEPTTPENTAPARAIHAALDLLRGGLTTTALLRLLKTGLVDLDRDSQCALENYAYTWPLHAQDWREPFTRNPEGYTDRMSEQSQQDLQRAEEARSFLVPRVQKFMDRARNADTATLTAQIYYFLQSLGAEEALQKLTDGLRACGDLPNADEALREWNVITELLDQMVHLLPAGEPITPADYDDLFTLLLRNAKLDDHAASGIRGELKLFQRFNQLIDSHYHQHWTVPDYACELHLTESRLTDICRRFANRPPKRLIFDRQLREARRLLLFSDSTVSEIAWQLGFKDPAYFARFFNRLVGCSPSAYRAQKVPVS